jgi:ribosomal protein S18 acetylase RimI-like enzyme
MGKAKTKKNASVVWSEDEVKLLKKFFPLGRAREVSERTGRSLTAVKQKAYKMGMKTRELRPWSANEVNLLKKLYQDEDIQSIAEKLGRSYSEVRGKAGNIGLRKKKYPVWSKQELTLLKKLYSDNQVRLQVVALAYKLGDFLRRLALPKSVKQLSLPHDESAIIQLRQMIIQDAPSTAALHIESISTGFISSLGIDFVTCLYEAMAQSKSSFGLVAEKNHRIVGFVTFTTNLSKLYKSVILKKGFRFALLLVSKMFSLKRMKKVLETLSYPTRTKKMDLPCAELLSIVIAEKERSKGLATTLMQRGLAECSRRGIEKVKVLVGADNEPANKLYSKCGFELIKQIDNHGIVSNIYVVESRKSRDGLLWQCKKCESEYIRKRLEQKRKGARRNLRYEDRHRVVNGIKQKFCRKCRRWKSESEFYKDRSQKDGLYDRCKKCSYKATNKSRKKRRLAV